MRRLVSSAGTQVSAATRCFRSSPLSFGAATEVLAQAIPATSRDTVSLNLLSWTVDASCHSFYRAQRIAPLKDRLPTIVSTIATSGADVVALQDSGTSIARAVDSTEYKLVEGASAQMRWGKVQLFLKKDAMWAAELQRHFGFITVKLQHLLHKHLSYTLVNADFSSLGEHEAVGMTREERKGQMVDYITQTIKADIACGFFSLQLKQHISEFEDASVTFAGSIDVPPTTMVWTPSKFKNSFSRKVAQSSTGDGEVPLTLQENALQYFKDGVPGTGRVTVKRDQRVFFRKESKLKVARCEVLKPLMEVTVDGNIVFVPASHSMPILTSLTVEDAAMLSS